MNFTTVTFFAIIIRFFWKTVWICSDHGWISSGFHVKTLLTSITNLVYEITWKLIRLLFEDLSRKTWISYRRLTIYYLPTAGTWNTFITMTFHCCVGKIRIPLNTLSVKVRAALIRVERKMLFDSKFCAL